MKSIIALLCLFPLLTFAQTDSSGRMVNPQTSNGSCCCCCPNYNYQMVERNRSLMIIAGTHDISQGGEMIGTFTKSYAANAGNPTNTLYFQLVNGTLVAEATCEVFSDSATVFTYRDQRTHVIPVTFTGIPEDEISQYLADHFYM
jgi:hypothetical protein